MNIRRIAVALIAMIFLSVIVPSPSSATENASDTQDPAKTTEGALYVGPLPTQQSPDSDPSGVVGKSLFGNCDAEAVADYIHVSSDTDARKASVHSYWYHLSGDCEPKLRVEAILYQWQCYTDMSDCWWELMGEKAKKVKPSTRQKKYNVVVKQNCRTSDLTSWLVDVEVTIPRRFWFDRHVYYTRMDDIDCRV